MSAIVCELSFVFRWKCYDWCLASEHEKKATVRHNGCNAWASIHVVMRFSAFSNKSDGQICMLKIKSVVNTIETLCEKKRSLSLNAHDFLAWRCFLIIRRLCFSYCFVALSLTTPFSDSSNNYKRNENKREFCPNYTLAFFVVALDKSAKSENTEKMNHVYGTIFKWNILLSICLWAPRKKNTQTYIDITQWNASIQSVSSYCHLLFTSF